MIQDVTFWTTIATSAIGIIASIIAIIKDKSKKSSEKLVDVAQIGEKLVDFINEAEQVFGASTGVAKLAYALNKTQIECLKNKIEYDEAFWKAKVEAILTTPQKKEV